MADMSEVVLKVGKNCGCEDVHSTLPLQSLER